MLVSFFNILLYAKLLLCTLHNFTISKKVQNLFVFFFKFINCSTSNYCIEFKIQSEKYGFCPDMIYLDFN